MLGKREEDPVECLGSKKGMGCAVGGPRREKSLSSAMVFDFNEDTHGMNESTTVTWQKERGISTK